MNVSAVWTDFGGVLTPPVADSLAAFCATHGLDRSEFLRAAATVSARYGTSDILEPLDTPLVGEQEWLGYMSEALGRPIHVSSFGEAWFDGRPANQEWIDTLRAVRHQGVGVSMMSNMVPTWDKYWRRMVDADELFDHVVLSFEVGARKPSKEIFSLAAIRAGVRPAECVLIDDVLDNCVGAEAAGWHAIHFVDSGSAAEQLWPLIT
ncbi:MAG TPA: HAD family phosphatase [Pseudonocardiaceae bacterium]